MQPRTRQGKKQESAGMPTVPSDLETAAVVALAGIRSMLTETIAAREKVIRSVMSIDAKRRILDSLRTTFQGGCMTLIMLREPLTGQPPPRPSREELESAFRTMSPTELFQYVQGIARQPNSDPGHQ